MHRLSGAISGGLSSLCANHLITFKSYSALFQLTASRSVHYSECLPDTLDALHEEAEGDLFEQYSFLSEPLLVGMDYRTSDDFGWEDYYSRRYVSITPSSLRCRVRETLAWDLGFQVAFLEVKAKRVDLNVFDVTSAHFSFEDFGLPTIRNQRVDSLLDTSIIVYRVADQTPDDWPEEIYPVSFTLGPIQIDSCGISGGVHRCLLPLDTGFPSDGELDDPTLAIDLEMMVGLEAVEKVKKPPREDLNSWEEFSWERSE